MSISSYYSAGVAVADRSNSNVPAALTTPQTNKNKDGMSFDDEQLLLTSYLTGGDGLSLFYYCSVLYCTVLCLAVLNAALLVKFAVTELLVFAPFAAK